MDLDPETSRLIKAVAEEAAKQTAEATRLQEKEVKRIVEETIGEIFVRLGMQHTNPLEMQKDMLHLRSWRLSTESLYSKGMVAVLTLAITGTLAALWVGLKQMIDKP